MKPSENILKSIRDKWDLSSNLNFVRKVENWVFKDSEKGVFIRITELNHRSLEQVQSELEWMSFLGNSGVSLAHPIRSLGNNCS